ncbi:MAG: DUF4179 domain-containing protein [Agathobacter sp.]|nr:DUF4179 domain-containing protein [Lachnobacterium sp.]MDY2911787.1 DUF4179 domain-containing protein [Agathobacter sp.]
MDEKKILQEDVELPEVVLSKANHALEMIRQEETENMAADNQKNSKKNTRRIKSQVAAAAAVCVLAVGGVSAVAAIHHNWGRGMSGNIQATDTEQQKLTDDGVAVVYPEKEEYEALKVTNNGVTIVPDTVIVDAQFAYLSFTISGYNLPEGEEPGFEDVNITSDDMGINMSGGMYDGIVCNEEGAPVYEDGSELKFTDSGDIVNHYYDENGNLEYFIQAHIAEAGDTMLGKTVKVDFKNLGSLYKTEFTDGVEGDWNFEITLPSVSSAKEFDVNKAIDGTSFTLTKLEISPVSLNATYTTDNAPEANQDDLGVPCVKGVVLKDGSRLPYLTDGGSIGYTDDSKTEAYNILGYDRVIDVDNVKALIISPTGNTSDTVEVDIQ